MVNPNNSGGNVERWLVEVEIMMKKGLAYAIDMSMLDHAACDRIDWVQKWAGQVNGNLSLIGFGLIGRYFKSSEDCRKHPYYCMAISPAPGALVGPPERESTYSRCRMPR